MNAQQAENLRILIRHMETNVPSNLYMPKVTHPCGTPACAMGHARTIPALGLPKWVTLEESACDVFGLDGSNKWLHWARLFGFSLTIRNPWYKSDEWLTRPTPQQWAAEARKVLKENGYRMEETHNAQAKQFVERMKRIEREPLPVTTEHGTALFPK